MSVKPFGEENGHDGDAGCSGNESGSGSGNGSGTKTGCGIWIAARQTDCETGIAIEIG
jgi:hypothetical protein